ERPSRLAQSLDLYVEGIGRSSSRQTGPARLYGARREDRSLRARRRRRVRSHRHANLAHRLASLAGGDVTTVAVEESRTSRRYAWPPFARSLAQVSRRPSVRLKTRRSGVESRSGQK